MVEAHMPNIDWDKTDGGLLEYIDDAESISGFRFRPPIGSRHDRRWHVTPLWAGDCGWSLWLTYKA
jgi:hypothetical protein